MGWARHVTLTLHSGAPEQAEGKDHVPIPEVFTVEDVSVKMHKQLDLLQVFLYSSARVSRLVFTNFSNSLQYYSTYYYNG